MGNGQYAKAAGVRQDAGIRQEMRLVQVSNMEILDSLHCPNCTGAVFGEAHRFFQLGPVASGTGKEETGTAPLQRCLTCGAVWDVSQLRRMTPAEREALLAAPQKRQAAALTQQGARGGQPGDPEGAHRPDSIGE
jgi:hypothetical protein